MKKILLVLLLSFGLWGCAGSNPFVLQDQAKLETPQEKAQSVIDNIKGALFAINRQVISDRKLGVYNDSEWSELKAQLNQSKNYVDDADVALSIGDAVLHKEKLQLAQDVLYYVKTTLLKNAEKEIK